MGDSLPRCAVDAPPPAPFRTVDLLGALSLAADLAVGLPAEHAVRSCYIGMCLAAHLRLAPEDRVALYYAELLMDVGCTAWTSHLAASILSDEISARRDFVFFRDHRNPLAVLGWLKDYVAAEAPASVRAQRMLRFALHGREEVREGFQNTCAVAQRFAQRLGMPEAVQTALLAVFEQWDGRGPQGVCGDQIPLTARIVYATSFLEAFHHIGGRGAATRLARQRKGTAFDPTVVDAFLDIGAHEGFWEGLEHAAVWTTVRSLEPPSPYGSVTAEKLDDIALAFADFADLKSRYMVGHSRRVAALARRLAGRMHLPDAQVTTIHRAALLHDLGLATVPSFILEKPRATLSPVEWERLRLHPYQAERILARVPALAPVVPLVAAHHERLDGAGYYRGLSGSQIPRGARIIAVADWFDELTHDTPDQHALAAEQALQQMGAEVGRGLCPDAYEALVQELRAPSPTLLARGRSRRRVWPCGLTAREVEVVRLLARGLSRRQMAAQLYVSEHTVRHHLEHIYAKIGVSTRVAATLFAVEHDLLT